MMSASLRVPVLSTYPVASISTQTMGMHPAAVVCIIPWYKYPAGVYSPQQQLNRQTQVTMYQPAVHVQSQGLLTTSLLASIPLRGQKKMLNGCLFPLIQDMAVKITSVLLDIDNTE